MIVTVVTTKVERVIFRALCIALTAIATLSPMRSNAASQGYEVVESNGFAYRIVSEGPLRGRVAWAFDDPDEGSDPLGLLLHHLHGAEELVWASYKPTHPQIVAALRGHARAVGVYDRNYCGSACAAAYKGDDRVTSVSRGVYKPRSKRKWFVMHHKFAVLDQGKDDTAAIFTGSFNWNARAATLNYENIVYIKSAKVAAAYSREYERIAGRGQGNEGPVRDGDITVAFNADVVALLTARIEAAQSEILVASWTINVASKKNPNPVYDALKSAVDRGVRVQILTDAHKAKKRNYGHMDVIKAHMPTKKGHMHHKFLIIDEEYVVTGSANFVTKALSGNDENMVAIRSPAMAASFIEHWNEMVSAVR